MSILPPRHKPARRAYGIVLLALAVSGLILPARANANLADDFARPDGATVGNGWIEKNPAAFRIRNGEVIKDSVGQSYTNNVMYRPIEEDVLDVEASVEFRLLSASPGYPQLFTRIESTTAAWSGELAGYILYINNSLTQAIVGRQRGSSFVTTLGTLNLSSALDTANRFRLRLRTEGTSPVQISAFVERRDGTTWTTIGQSMVTDASSARITTAGSVGFSGYTEAAYAYDNFVRVNIGGGTSNPVPAITALAPAAAQAGESGFELTVYGSGFTINSAVRWNGSNRATSFVSADELTAAITPADQQSAGTYQVTVSNPAPGGGISNAVPFTIEPAAAPNPAPVASGLNPQSANAGSGAFALTVTGSAFASTAVVRWNGNDRATTFISPTELRASIGSTDVATAGAAEVRVFNPTPGGGLSGPLTFTIAAAPPSNPVPVASALDPASVQAGSGAFTLTVDGSNFVPSSVVSLGGSDRPTTYVSPTRLQAAIPAPDILTGGTRSIRVISPSPGGGTSGSLTLTVTAPGSSNPVPVLSRASQHTALAGSGSTTITLYGSGYFSGTQARWNGSNRVTQVTSSTEASITLLSADLAAAGSGVITVSNPAPGGGVSEPLTLLILGEGGTAFFDNFNRADNGVLGNGWIEKSPSAFWLAGGRVIGQETSYDYHDAIIYRPTAEDRRDVEVGVEFIRGEGNFGEGFPQVHARVQRDSVTAPDTLESYIFFVEDFLSPARAMIAVQPPVSGSYECYLTQIFFPESLQPGQRYRLRFRVTGVSPVVLTGIVERYASSGWSEFASGSVNHVAGMPRDPNLFCGHPQVPDPILDAGSTGLSKWETRPDPYDNFHWIDLGSGTSPPGPASPAVSALSPSSLAAGSAATQVIVTGSDFNENSVAQFGGSNRATTFLSSSQVQIALSASDLSMPGDYPITVVNPGTPPLMSNAVNLSVTAVTPPATGFFDDFARGDSASLGNGWIEKNPAAFTLAGGAAVKQAVGSSYVNNLAYRPATENALDGEASVEVRFLSGSVGYPQVLTRVQTNTVANSGMFDGYILYVNNSTTQAILGRQRGSAFVTGLAAISLSEPFNTADRYRLRISANGTSPVQLAGYVERWNGGSWIVIGSANVSDASAERISAPGTAGFGGYVEAAYLYDNFWRN